jgi:hypothetical protein
MAAKRAAGYSAIGYTIARVLDCSMGSLGLAALEHADGARSTRRPEICI